MSTTLFFLNWVGYGDVEATNVDTAELLDRLATAESVSPEAWRLLARLCRYLALTLQEARDPRLLLVHQLHRKILTHADAAASAAEGSAT